MVSTVEDIQLEIYIAGGVTASCILLLFILVGILWFKIKRLANHGMNQLGSQRNMMADFCYTNPAIVPGEELSRRGYSMYSGNISTTVASTVAPKNNDYGIYQESRSQF